MVGAIARGTDTSGVRVRNAIEASSRTNPFQTGANSDPILDDLNAAVAKATADTQKLVSDVAAQVAALQAALAAAGGPDLTAVTASVNALDAIVTAADAATQPAPSAPSV